MAVSDDENFPRNFPFLIKANDGIFVRPQYPKEYLFTSTSHLYHSITVDLS